MCSQATRQPDEIGRVRPAGADRGLGHEGEFVHHAERLKTRRLGQHDRAHCAHFGLHETRIHSDRAEHLGHRHRESCDHVRRRGERHQHGQCADALDVEAVSHCSSATSDHRALEPQRLTRFGADHLIRQLRDGTDGRVTANELRRYYITTQLDKGVSLDDLRVSAGLADRRGISRLVAVRQPVPPPSPPPQPTP